MLNRKSKSASTWYGERTLGSDAKRPLVTSPHPAQPINGLLAYNLTGNHLPTTETAPRRSLLADFLLVTGRES